MNELHIELFTLIYKKYYSYIVHFINSYIGESEQDKEIAQEVFLSFWNLVKSDKLVDNERMILSLLLTIAKNKSLNELRRRNHFYKYSLHATYVEKSTYLNMVALESDFSTNIYEKEVKEILSSSISKMDDRLRSTLVLSRIDGLKNAEVAQKQGISKRTVENRLHHAINILKGDLSDYYQTNDR